jgi:hypothetical protein
VSSRADVSRDLLRRYEKIVYQVNSRERHPSGIRPMSLELRRNQQQKPSQLAYGGVYRKSLNNTKVSLGRLLMNYPAASGRGINFRSLY